MDSLRRWFKMSHQTRPQRWVCTVQPRENIGHDLGTVKKREREFFAAVSAASVQPSRLGVPGDDCSADSWKKTRKQQTACAHGDRRYCL